MNHFVQPLFGDLENFDPECVGSTKHFQILDSNYLDSITKTGRLYKKLKNFCDGLPNLDYSSELSFIFTNNGKLNIDSESDSSVEFYSHNTHPRDFIENTDKIIEIDTNFEEITDELIEIDNNLNTKNELVTSSYYLSCFANSIKSYLNEYRNYLTNLRNGTHSPVSLTTLSNFIDNQFKLLQLLYNIIVQYEYKSLKYKDTFAKFKCLLEILYQDNPDEFINIVNSKLRYDLLGLLKSQLTYWLVYGKLIDPFGEFVISSPESDNPGLNSKSPNFFINDLLTYTPITSSSESNHFLLINNIVYHSRINNNVTFGPVNYNTANTILMIGKIIPIVNYLNKNGLKTKVLKRLIDDCIFNYWNEVTLDTEKFSSAIESYRLHISTLLWDVYNPKYNILNKIRMLKGIYFLFNESLYDKFFEQSYDIMAMDFGDNELKSVNKSFTTLFNRLKDDMSGENREENQNSDKFELIKCVNHFNINSSFKLINDIKFIKGCYELGNESGIWYSDLIYITNGFNMNFIIGLQLVDQYRRFSVVLSPKIFNSVNGRSYNEYRTVNNKCLSISFRINPLNSANLTVCIDIMLNHDNGSECDNKYTKTLLSRMESVFEYKESNLKLGIELMFKRNSFKVFLKSVDDEFCFPDNYSPHNNLSNNLNNYFPNDLSSDLCFLSQSDSLDNEYNSSVNDVESVVDGTNSTKSTEDEKFYDVANDSIDLKTEINQQDVIELLKLVSDFSYIGIVHHSTKDKDLNNSTPKLNHDGIDNNIKILSWNYYSINYDTLNYNKPQNNLSNVSNSNPVPFNYDGSDNWVNIILYYKCKDINFINVRPYYQPFQILFNIKRIVYGLENKFLIDYKLRTSYTEKKSASIHSERRLLLRKILAFRHYLHSRLSLLLSSLYSLVIVPNFQELESFMNDSNDFLQIIHKHDEYITKIQRKFMCNERVVHSFIQSLDVCLKFTQMFDKFNEFPELSDEKVYQFSTSIDQFRSTFEDNFALVKSNYNLI
ncbi:Spc97 / Spc98 family protein [Theileria parva strain Muguga]|uniref:Spc97 / Spc98 family protein n=1 Tax=Theileria parva strain Muguga TaxID=333668 RepID=UPI001C61A00D|nr:Spc97 / Spc98 family protein [Theileria parva strain Muguga]EAN32958.2 Spc97 / Spc98 family protein [Theileria parva strain Muguga]